MMSKVSLIRQVQLKKGTVGCITPQQVNWRLLIAYSCCIFKLVLGNITSPSVNF